MIDRGKFDVLGVGVDAVDYEAAVDRIIRAAAEGEPYTVTALAVHGLMTGALDAEHRARLNEFDLVCPDGMPVRWSLDRLYGTELPDRVYGPDLTLRICERAARDGLAVYFYGSQPDVVARLAVRMGTLVPGLEVAGFRPSAFRMLSEAERDGVASDIRASGARILFVGLGCPRQERWVHTMRSRLPMPAIAVGAAFDFHAGGLAQAPPPMQRMGLEWLYRLSREPRRLWRRYLYLNPLFVAMLGMQAVRMSREKRLSGEASRGGG